MAEIIARHTRYEGKTAEEWARLQQQTAFVVREVNLRAEAAEAKVKELEAALDREKLHAAQWARRNEELEAKLDAVEIDNIGHAHALSMLRGLFGLPLDGTLYDEIWQKHIALMEAAKLACAEAAERALQAAPDYESMHTMVRAAIMQVGNDQVERRAPSTFAPTPGSASGE
jgi:hypothetical protein